MPVIGTAGHVDHGKSTLIRALTGRDPDRWEEEKRRGLTIDLGFSWMRLPGGTEVSFVDVPGHERFIKNMLAGIEAIDVALLVVAADEGWKPQSEEHLAVLDLLGVERGVVALTKVDRADDELVALASLEVEERLEGTSLAGSPIVPVSAVRGVGLPQLVEALEAAVPPEGPSGDRPRMWIDRSFSITGAGTVVTGTLLGGPLAIGDQVRLWPAGLDARIRGLQSHEAAVERAEPGRRLAANLAGVDRDQVERGAMLGVESHWRPTSRFLARVRPARYVEDLGDRGAYHIHVGSGGWPVRLRMLAPGVARIDLPRPLPLQVGDRFILRETGRRMVVGGGRVLDPAPAARPDLDLLARLEDEPDPDARATALLAVRGREDLSVLAAHSGGGRPRGAVLLGAVALEPTVARDLGERISTEVAGFHRANPLRPGLPLAEAAARVGLTPQQVASLVAGRDDLEVDEAVVRQKGFTGGRSEEDERRWKEARRRLEEAGAREVPRESELGLPTDLLHALVREGELVRVSPEFVYLPEQVAELVEVIRSFDQPFTVSQFRDRAGISRKYAVPLLEWADDNGLTVRMGDTRRVR